MEHLGPSGILQLLLLSAEGWGQDGDPPQDGWVEIQSMGLEGWSNFNRILLPHSMLCDLEPVASPL